MKSLGPTTARRTSAEHIKDKGHGNGDKIKGPPGERTEETGQSTWTCACAMAFAFTWTWVGLGTKWQTSMPWIHLSFMISSMSDRAFGFGSSIFRMTGRHARGERLLIVGGQAD